MKTTLIAIISLLVGLVIGWMLLDGSASSGAATTGTGEQTKNQQYTCGMHPEIVSDEPGVCPICNMNLTPKRDAGSSAGSVAIDPVTRQNMGLVTVEATYHHIERTVRAFGRVAVRDPNRHNINVKVNGWVERLFVNEPGEQVFQGQPLLELYAPRLVAAQREYLIASRATGPHMPALVTAARDRLRNYDISEDQIERLLSEGDAARTMTIRSPVSGFVVTKLVNQGDHLSPGRDLYEVVDLSTVWVTAHVYEQDAPHVAVGQSAVVRFPRLPGSDYVGRVEYVSPFLVDKRQLEIRVTLDNHDLMLRPQMYAEVTLISELPAEQLVIPRQSIINSGVKEIVYVATAEGSYEPRRVTTGVIGDNDMIQVVSGLQAGERVVASGQFLLDSESRLGESLGAHAHGSHGQDTDQSTARAAPGSSHSDHQHDADPYNIHTCPMPEHFHVLTYGPGTCPECGMDLVPTGQTGNTEVYVCPMPQCRVAESEPGTCPVCNMHLMKYEPETDHAQ
jgi:Cu(I)/Ag(I) efflux system membrane fusion protein/cobalt-zinc-cadmium efflux system membrane fusion protein